jgi:hypothetical protein
LPDEKYCIRLGSYYPNQAATPEARERVVQATLDFVKGTALEPQRYEQTLLRLFFEGNLTIEQVIERLEAFE